MSDLILHHYALSPFSEKIRKMLGYTGLSWESVIIREMPPRPALEQLTGGYRKVPVVQIGADIFCDSRTIAAEIAALSGKPDLALEHCTVEVQDYVARVDLDIFFAALLASGTLKLGRNVLKSMSLLDIGRFFGDRIKLGRAASVRRFGVKEARRLLFAHLVDLESRLQQDYLFGAEPKHADFSTYHSLWFSRDVAETRHFEDYPKVSVWMDRIKAFGDGHSSEITAEQALERAGNATPRPIADEYRGDPQIGRRVRIGPADYAKDQTEGQLVGSTPSQWILAREADGLGSLHVHFPKQGYALNPAE